MTSHPGPQACNTLANQAPQTLKYYSHITIKGVRPEPNLTCSLPLINHCHYYPWYRNLEPGQVKDSEFHSDPTSYNVSVSVHIRVVKADFLKAVREAVV